MARRTKQPNRDHQINTALHHGIEQMKSHAEVMKKAGAANDAMAKHQALQQKHAAMRAGGNAPARQRGARKNTRKPVSKQQGARQP